MMLAFISCYLWSGPVLVALVFGYVTYHIYKDYKNNSKK